MKFLIACTYRAKLGDKVTIKIEYLNAIIVGICNVNSII